jgi:hypothetical protein
MVPAGITLDSGLLIALILWGLLVTTLVAGMTVSELRWGRLLTSFFRRWGRPCRPWGTSRPRAVAGVRPLLAPPWSLHRLHRRPRALRHGLWRERPRYLKVVR